MAEFKGSEIEDAETRGKFLFTMLNEINKKIAAIRRDKYNIRYTFAALEHIRDSAQEAINILSIRFPQFAPKKEEDNKTE